MGILSLCRNLHSVITFSAMIRGVTNRAGAELDTECSRFDKPPRLRLRRGSKAALLIRVQSPITMMLRQLEQAVTGTESALHSDYERQARSTRPTGAMATPNAIRTRRHADVRVIRIVGAKRSSSDVDHLASCVDAKNCFLTA